VKKDQALRVGAEITGVDPAGDTVFSYLEIFQHEFLSSRARDYHKSGILCMEIWLSSISAT